MKIRRLFINNYKSLVNFELVEPNPFSVFVGPNAAGKSNVFEALEFLSFTDNYTRADGLFEGANNYLNQKSQKSIRSIRALNENKGRIQYNLNISIDFIEFKVEANILYFSKDESYLPGVMTEEDAGYIEKEDTNVRWFDTSKKRFQEAFSRIFIGKTSLVKSPIKSSNKLAFDSSNLEPVLHRILQDEPKQEEIIDWLQMLIPDFEKIEVAKSDLSGDYFLKIFEKHLDEPIGKNLISDGTYNILALLTAVYQSDEPQFLCIEEPENGLNPYVIRTLVDFFRQACEEKGHYIWLNTHSATLVKELQPKELILINKVGGVTKPKQVDPNLKFKSMPLDEAWLTNSLGGGLPW